MFQFRKQLTGIHNINIHNDGCNTVNAACSEFGIFLGCIVTKTAREFNDAVMHLDTNCAGNDILFTIKLREDILLNLHIVFHQTVPSWPSDAERRNWSMSGGGCLDATALSLELRALNQPFARKARCRGGWREPCLVNARTLRAYLGRKRRGFNKFAC